MTHSLRRVTTIFKPFTSQTFKSYPLTRITYILSNYPQPEPELDRVTFLLTFKTMSYVLSRPPTLKSGFRFFLWATRYRSLRAWNFVNLIHDILLFKNNDGFTVFWDTLHEMRKCGVVIPSEAFLVLVSGYFKAGFAHKAVETFGMMKDFDCKPNVFTFNAVLYGMIEEDLCLLALAVYNQMLKCNCAPNVATYSILIHGLCNIGKVEDALLLFDEMTKRGVLPNTVTYTIVLMGLCRAGRPYEAIDLLLNGMMSGKSCRPDRVTWDGLLAGFCKLGKVDEAFLLSKVFETQGYVLGVKGHSCLIDGLFRAGRFEEANNWFRKLVEENVVAPDVVMYTIMIRGLCEAGSVKDAFELFLEMTDKGVVPDTQCYNVLIKGFCDVGLLQEAQSLKLEISKNDCFPDTHTNTILICGMCRNGLVGEARQIFEEMEKQGCLPSVVTFNALIDGFCKNGRLEEACLMFYKMEVGRNPFLCLRLSQGTNRVKDKASLQNLIVGLCESGLSLKAYMLLTKLAEKGIVPDIVSYNILINGMCRSRNMDGAFKIFRELQLMGESPDAVTYGTLINGLCTAHREEEAMRMVEDMINNGITPSSSIYRSLMTWSCRRRKVLMSFRLWMNYLRRVKNLDNDVIRLVEEHFEKGDVEKAIRCLLKIDIKMKDFDLGPYTIWLIGFCQARRLDEALKIFYVLQEFGVSIPAPSCVRLIQACCVARELDQAADVFGYALEKGYMITPQKCSLILCSMFRSKPHVYNAISLVNKMDAMGFDLDTHLSLETKALWQHHIAMHNLPEIKYGVAG